MNVCIIGTGYVGLPSGVGFAELGHNVTCVDREAQKIEKLQQGIVTLYEQDLEELLQKNIKKQRIKFTTSLKEGVSQADIVILAVGTPPHPVTKEADMKYVYSAASELADFLTDYTVIAIKSTVPVGTGDTVDSLIRKKNSQVDFDIVSLPEFLREGFAMYDFFHPDRIIIGAESQRAKEKITELYQGLEHKTNMLFVQRRSSETIKYASNSFLAIKVHYINEMADFCEKAGVDVFEVAKGMGLDSRIGNKFLNPGPGYGGSCFPKDTLAMAYMARMNEVDMTLINSAIKGNNTRKIKIAHNILEATKYIPQAKIGILGLAFKDGTDDCRESPALEIVAELIEHNAKMRVYDPKALENAQELLGDKLEYAKDMYHAAENADVLVILTEWQDFKSLDLKKVAELMAHKTIIDYRNILDPQEALKLGFKYFGVGRGNLKA